MATVDDRVVSMSFESSKFESGVNATISALEKLKAALSFPGAGKGLDQISESASKVDLNPIAKALDFIKGKFSTLGVIAISVLNNITNKVVDAGLQFAKSLAIDPIVAGFKNYETQINAVQTILANTGLTGKKGLDQVNNALNQLNTYANKTVYNFSEMAKNIGTFTAAGVDLKTSTASIKGIANLAALSGSNADQASSAMYQLSQAIASGTTKLQDWNSVVNAGMGGKVFQKALFDTGEAMGTIKNAKVGETFDQWTKAGNSFRESLKSGWLTSKVLTTTLKGFTGDMTTAQLKAEGYTDAQIKNIQKVSKAALGAAVNIKTMSQLTDALKEEVATAWAAIFKTIFGDINGATKLFSSIHTVAENALTKPIYDLNALLEGWAKLGGRTALIDGLKQAWKDLGAVMAPIKAAFRDIFPPTTAQQLVNMTKAFDDFMKSLMPSQQTIDNLKRTFQGLFAILDIGKQLLGGIFTVFGQLFGVISKGGGGFLNLTGNIGDFLVSVDQALKSGNRLHDFFVTLGSILAKPLQLIGKLAGAIGDLFSGFGSKASGGLSNIFSSLGSGLSPLQTIIAGIQKVWDKFIGSFGNADQVLKPMIQGLSNLWGSIGDAISSAIQNINWQTTLQTIQTGLLGGMFLMIKNFFSKGGFSGALGGGILKNISGAFEALTGSLEALQKNIQARTLLTIATAIGVLTASIVALSLINPKKLDNAMTGISLAFGELLGAMAILTKISGAAGFVKVPIIAASMTLLAGSVLILSGAVKVLAGLDWEQLAKGLGGVGVLLAEISAAAGPLSRNSAGLISAGVGIAAIAVAMKILASAVSSFGGMSWGEIGKGLASVGVALAGIGAASKLFPAGGMIQIGVGLIGVAAGMKLLASAVATFGSMQWGVIAKGMASIAGALLILAGAMKLMPTGMAAQAAGLILVGVALNIMAKALGSFGGMSIAEIAKGLGTLAASLLILAVALDAMSGSLTGAAALAVAAASMALLAPALESLGKQSWGDIIKGMVALAAALAILGAAGALLAPVAPALLALGVALLAIGGGLALAGAGIALVGTGLSAIAVSGPIAIGVLLKGFTDFVAALPGVVNSVIQTLLNIVTSIAAAAPKFVTALGQILTALANAVVAALPTIVKAFDALVTAALTVIQNNFPQLVNAGLQMLISLLNGIKNNIGQLVSTAVNLVTTFLGSIAGKLGSVISAGAKVLSSLLDGIANNIGTVVSAALNIVLSFVNGIANNIGKVINAGANVVANIVQGIGNAAGKIVSAGGNAIASFITGVGDAASKIVTAGANAIGKFVGAVASGANDLVDKGGQAIVNFMNGVAASIRKYEPQMISAGAGIGEAICQGMINGLGNLAGSVIHKAESIITGIPGAAKKLLGIGSPSKVFIEIGEQTMTGLVIGLNNMSDDVNSATSDVVTGMVGTMSDTLASLPNMLSNVVDLNPTVTPVLDLSQVQQGAQDMSNMLNVVPITAAASYGQASAISTDQSQTSTDSAVPGVGGPSITFEQNNYSPEALSPTEIYRQTRNQLSQARSALAP